MSITRFAASTVSIITFSPGSGPVGATVTISGTGFSTTPGLNTITFNGTATTVVSSTATRLVTTVPPGATTGAIAVTSPSGSATSASSFTVTTSGPPTISSLSPAVGAPGDSTTITGTNYETTLANNRVAFNVTRPIYGRVTSATATSLAVLVPVGATSGRVSVTTPGGKATSTADFFVPPSPYTAASVVFTSRLVVDGSNVVVTIPTASKIGMVVFDAVAGQRLSLGLTAITLGVGTGITIYKPDGALLTNPQVQFPASAIDLDPLPVTGTYTLVVTPGGTSTGNITLTLSQEVTGTLTVGGAALPVSITRAGQRARITFTGTAGQRLDLGLTGSTFSGAASVLKPDGTLLGSTQTFASGDNALDTLPALPVSGTYAILVDPNNANTGNITLTLSEEVAATITVDGTALPLTISRAGQQARVTFSGTAGQRLSLGLTSITLSSSWVSFLNPDGNTLLAPQFFGTTNAAFDPPALATTGTYTILLDPASAYTGNATLTLSTEVTGSITADGTAVPLTISRAGQRARLTFAGTSGQRVSLHMTGLSITSGTVSILRPNGTVVGSIHNFSGTSSFMDPRTLDVTGTHALLIDPQAVYTGSVTLALYTVPADVTGTLTVNGAAVPVSLTVPGQKAIFTFTGTAGQPYTARGANSTLGCLNLFLLRPDGAQASQSPCTASYTLATTSGTSGTFTVTVDPQSANIGSVDLSVTNP